MTAHEHCFTRKERLRLRADFARVFSNRRRAGDDLLVVYVADNRLGWSRLGISVGKKVGKAVLRNYVRRRIREAFRTTKADLPRGLDIICVAKPNVADPACDIARSIRALVVRAARKKGRAGNKDA